MLHMACSRTFAQEAFCKGFQTAQSLFQQKTFITLRPISADFKNQHIGMFANLLGQKLGRLPCEDMVRRKIEIGTVSPQHIEIMGCWP